MFTISICFGYPDSTVKREASHKQPEFFQHNSLKVYENKGMKWEGIFSWIHYENSRTIGQTGGVDRNSTLIFTSASSIQNLTKDCKNGYYLLLQSRCAQGLCIYSRGYFQANCQAIHNLNTFTISKMLKGRASLLNTTPMVLYKKENNEFHLHSVTVCLLKTLCPEHTLYN